MPFQLLRRGIWTYKGAGGVCEMRTCLAWVCVGDEGCEWIRGLG